MHSDRIGSYIALLTAIRLYGVQTNDGTLFSASK